MLHTKSAAKAVRILSDQGICIMELEETYKGGDKLRMRGKLMGGFPTNMYITAEDFYRLIPMVMGPATFMFALLSPFYWVRSYRRTHSRVSTAKALAKMLFLRVIPVCLVTAFVVAMTILGIYSLVV